MTQNSNPSKIDLPNVRDARLFLSFTRVVETAVSSALLLTLLFAAHPPTGQPGRQKLSAGETPVVKPTPEQLASLKLEFDKNETKLKPEQVAALNEWGKTLDIPQSQARLRSAKCVFVDITGYAAPGEDNPEKRAAERAYAVSDAFTVKVGGTTARANDAVDKKSEKGYVRLQCLRFDDY